MCSVPTENTRGSLASTGPRTLSALVNRLWRHCCRASLSWRRSKLGGTFVIRVSSFQLKLHTTLQSHYISLVSDAVCSNRLPAGHASFHVHKTVSETVLLLRVRVCGTVCIDSRSNPRSRQSPLCRNSIFATVGQKRAGNFMKPALNHNPNPIRPTRLAVHDPNQPTYGRVMT